VRRKRNVKKKHESNTKKGDLKASKMLDIKFIKTLMVNCSIPCAEWDMFSKKNKNLGNALLFRLTVLYAVAFILQALIGFMMFYFLIYSATMERMDRGLAGEAGQHYAILADSGSEGIKYKISEDADEYLASLRGMFSNLIIAQIIVSVIIGWHLARRALVDIEVPAGPPRKYQFDQLTGGHMSKAG
jgi:hypothetical protein